MALVLAHASIVRAFSCDPNTQVVLLQLSGLPCVIHLHRLLSEAIILELLGEVRVPFLLLWPLLFRGEGAVNVASEELPLLLNLHFLVVCVDSRRSCDPNDLSHLLVASLSAKLEAVRQLHHLRVEGPEGGEDVIQCERSLDFSLVLIFLLELVLGPAGIKRAPVKSRCNCQFVI